MRRHLFLKALAIAGLMILLLIPLAMVKGQVEERRVRHQTVQANIADSAAGPQQLTGPVLVLTWTERVTHEKLEDKTLVRKEVDEHRHRIIVPRELQITGEAKVEQRSRGLYKAHLFHLNGSLKGRFSIPELYNAKENRWPITPGKASLVLGLTDLRGIRNRPLLQVGDQKLEFEPGVPSKILPSGIQARLGRTDQWLGREFSFEIPLELTGSQTLSVAPVAEETRMKLRSPWPDPSFGGRFLPVNRQVSEQGFEAEWQVFHLARNLERILPRSEGGFTCEAFEIQFIEAVNVYLQSERAVKYGFLFVGLTFMAFFFFEILKRLPIHPMQYLLVGLSLALFFLLLLSLSEHIPFLGAYLLASSSSILLLGAYLVHVLQSPSRGWGFAGALTLLFGVLYGLLISEDNALLMGSLLLFGALAAVMLATRKLDWYGLSREPQQP